jgi:hypothetical protein
MSIRKIILEELEDFDWVQDRVDYEWPEVKTKIINHFQKLLDDEYAEIIIKTDDNEAVYINSVECDEDTGYCGGVYVRYKGVNEYEVGRLYYRYGHDDPEHYDTDDVYIVDSIDDGVLRDMGNELNI